MISNFSKSSYLVGIHAEPKSILKGLRFGALCADNLAQILRPSYKVPQ